MISSLTCRFRETNIRRLERHNCAFFRLGLSGLFRSSGKLTLDLLRGMVFIETCLRSICDIIGDGNSSFELR